MVLARAGERRVRVEKEPVRDEFADMTGSEALTRARELGYKLVAETVDDGETAITFYAPGDTKMTAPAHVLALSELPSLTDYNDGLYAEVLDELAEEEAALDERVSPILTRIEEVADEETTAKHTWLMAAEEVEEATLRARLDALDGKLGRLAFYRQELNIILARPIMIGRETREKVYAAFVNNKQMSEREIDTLTDRMGRVFDEFDTALDRLLLHIEHGMPDLKTPVRSHNEETFEPAPPLAASHPFRDDATF